MGLCIHDVEVRRSVSRLPCDFGTAQTSNVFLQRSKAILSSLLLLRIVSVSPYPCVQCWYMQVGVRRQSSLAALRSLLRSHLYRWKNTFLSASVSVRNLKVLSVRERK